MPLDVELSLAVDAGTGVGVVQKAAAGTGDGLRFRKWGTARLTDHRAQLVGRTTVGADDVLRAWTDAAPGASGTTVELHCIPNLVAELDAAHVTRDIIQFMDDVPRIEQREQSTLG